MDKMNRPEERGQSLVLIAVAAIALIAFVSLAIDGGMAYNQRRIAQNAADAAAIAGTYEVRMQNRATNARDQSVVLTKILNAVESHGVPLQRDGSNNVTNVAGYYTTDQGVVLGTCKIGACDTTIINQAWGVKVDVANPFTTFFAGVVGWREMNVGASSLAVTRAGARGKGGYWAIVATAKHPEALKGNSAPLSISGGGQQIHVYGSVHSNGTFDGPSDQNWTLHDSQITYKGVCKGCEQSSPTAEEKTFNLVYPTYSDFEELALASGTKYGSSQNAGPGTPIGSVNQPITYINGNLTCDGGTLHGLVVVTGWVQIDDKKGPCQGTYTIAAKGNIDFSGGSNLLTGTNGPYRNPDYELLAENGNRFVTASNFAMSGSNNTITGAIIAEYELSISGSNNKFFGAMIGNQVSISGAGSTITYEPEYFPPQPDFIELLQ